ncbi:MAG TPA: PQQ-dependent sugar dehydrogenase [Puia sp.]|nr:PQQ-dependent sugar dehydrogenase [Puia sp.]
MTSTRRLLSPLLLSFLLSVLFSCNSRREGKPRVLIFSKTAAPSEWQSLSSLAASNGWTTDTTSDETRFREDSLKLYSAVVFLNTPGNTLDNYEQKDLERYIQAGGGYAGIRSATTSRYEWGWYRRMTGSDSSHIGIFSQEYDGGRAWYLDSLKDGASDTAAPRLLIEGIRYAIGDNNNLNYARAKTLRTPENERFTKTTLAQGVFFEPTEMTILPNLDILVVQRRGEILLYNHTTQQVKQAGFLDVYFKTQHTPGVNAEEGLLGVQADPDFARNHFVYMYYSPIDSSVNRLSRFTLTGDSIDKKSEKVVLEVKAQREICCHTGGSIAFGPNHTLFVSTGDNSTPFDEPNTPYPSHGYAPLDDRPGHLQYDSRRGAGNTNDLRGKILRIKINPDGSYDIPEGNLFPKGEDKTRPEIYVMGDRNPYRISVDKKNSYLYWGEVGPDANQDSLDTRGPRGYDEVNQARAAGFFGWPYFVGDNYAYHRHDYATGANGPAFDPAKPVNESRNNTGLHDLPPAQPAFVWYPYGPSTEFPQVGTGGRCAMAGPVFYSDLYPDSTRLPDYYNGKFIMYDWVRGWFRAVTMRSNGDLDNMEPFLDHLKFNAPVDMELGPDGKLYVLEYGNGWFTKNPDAAISRIDYNGGNVAPLVSDFQVDKTSGLLPLKVHFSVKARDFEKDSLSYVWDAGDGHTQETSTPTFDYTYTKPGDYALSVTVKDAKNASSKSSVIGIYAGNATPSVDVKVKGNRGFYFEGHPVSYSVSVDDPADTGRTKDMKGLVVSADYAEGSDKAASPQGHQVLSGAIEGKNIMLSLDCKTCHKIDEKSIGPSFTDVAKRYAKDADMVSKLMQKVVKGGSGVWGEVAMPAHPTLKEDDLRQIISWIQTLSGTDKTIPSLPASGSVDPTMHHPVKDNGVLTITASYTNKGGENIRPLTGSGSVSLRNSRLPFRRASSLIGPFHKDNIDLTEVTGAEIGVYWSGKPGAAYHLAIYLDSATGKKLGEVNLTGSGKATSPDNKEWLETAHVKLLPVTDGAWHKLYIVGSRPTAASTPAAPANSASGAATEVLVAPEVGVTHWFIRLLK